MFYKSRPINMAVDSSGGYYQAGRVQPDPKKIDQVLNRSLDERSSTCLSDVLLSGTATGGVMTPLSSARKGLLSRLSILFLVLLLAAGVGIMTGCGSSGSGA